MTQKLKLNLAILMAKNNIKRQKDLANATGIDASCISRYFNDNFKKIDRDHLVTLCEYFNCSLSELLELVNEK